jgi:hypothetical protein
MKKIIKKFWGVAFVIILLSTLFVAGAPSASAGTLYFTGATSPSDKIGGITANNTNIYDFVVGYDNTTFYAASSNGALKSVNAGRTWTQLTSLVFPDYVGSSLHVAVAPDDVNYVAYMTQASCNVSLSKDGGMTFQSLGIAKDGNNLAAVNVYDIAISKSAEVAIIGGYATSHVLAVAGATLTRAALYYCLTDLIGSEGGWKDAVRPNNENLPIAGQNYAGVDKQFNAVKFSPSFDRDRIAYILGSNNTPATVNLHVLSFNNARFNSGISGFTGYIDAGSPLGTTDPNTMVTGVATFANKINRAQIVFDPNYMGLENETRTAYFSIAAETNNLGGVWRVTDNSAAPLFVQMGAITYLPGWAMSSLSINSDGTVIAVAAMQSNKVWTLRSLFMGNLCSVTLNNPMKRIGVTTVTDNQTVVYGAGSNLYAAKQSTEGAFSLSVDDGYTFNDISLVKTTLINILDQVVAPDGGNRYVISNDDWFVAGHCSVFYWDGTYWERTFVPFGTVAGTNDSFVAEASPTNFAILYLADKNSAHVFYTATAGTVNWKDYQSPKANTTLADIAVESDALLYAATMVDGKGYVSTLTENGRIWAIPTNPTFFSVSASDKLASLTLVSPGNLIAGSADCGRLAYSVDGGATWRCSSINYAAGVCNVFADTYSLADGSMIYVVFDTLGYVTYWTVGTSSAASWTAFSVCSLSGIWPTADPAFTQKMQGVKYYNGAVYAISSNASMETWLYRAFLPALGLPGFGEWAATNIQANMLYSSDLWTAYAGVKPNVLKASTGSQIWFIDINGYLPVGGNTFLDRVLTYTDTLVAASPAPSSPMNKYLIQVNKETGRAYDVTLIWSVASSASHYQYQVAKDSAFSVIVLDGTAAAALFAPTAHILIGPSQVGATVYINYQPGETYYWRVRAMPYQFAPGVGWYYHFYSQWSAVYTLEIQPAPPPVPELNSPMNGGVAYSLKPGFSWSVMSGEAPASGITMTYTFQLATDAAFSTTSMVYTTTTTVAGLNLPVSLTDGSQYFWRVCTTTSVTGDWSTVANFRVSLATAPITITQTNSTVVLTQTNPPATSITVAASHTENVVNPSYIWAIIIIGAVLVIAIIVLIVRTRRVG